MKITMITPYYLPYLAGAELYVYEVSKYLIKNGHKVNIVTKHFGNLKKFEVMGGINVYRVKSIDLPQIRSLIAFPFMFLKALKLAKKSDLIHAHIAYPSGIIAMLIKSLTKKPYIITSQGDELMDYPEKKLLKFLKSPIKRSLKKANHIHCISKALFNNIKDFFDINPKNITIIPNGVDLNLFNSAKKVDLKKKFKSKNILINVSRLTKKNNVESVIKAMTKLDKNTRLIIVGDGPERKNLEQLAKKLNVQVIFTGNIDHKKIPSLIKGADIFIRTPRTEGLGNVFLESMASNVPIIASPIGGILDIIKNNENGLLVNQNNVEEIASAIKKLLKDNNLREKLIKNGSKFVKDYDWNTIGEKTFKIYKNLI